MILIWPILHIKRLLEVKVNITHVTTHFDYLWLCYAFDTSSFNFDSASIRVVCFSLNLFFGPNCLPSSGHSGLNWTLQSETRSRDRSAIAYQDQTEKKSSDQNHPNTSNVCIMCICISHDRHIFLFVTWWAKQFYKTFDFSCL